MELRPRKHIKKKGSTEPIYAELAPLFHFIRCYIKCLHFSISIPTFPPSVRIAHCPFDLSHPL